ncbi:hypothetical protein FB567DRAFT_501810 [Paraphoma chrysanthemicola]|uniref:Rhodopsin domain-containing protein n=1 Tax=Paraphoma chrysanthemicola TaxID=798071 RepID=A0A8K0QZ34_9PLEO|nr:hypothetical protein FB567DRAFT_501810 [Paraphoma chrysanthemicola]
MSSSNPLPKTPIALDELVRTNAAMLVLTSLFVLLRVAVQISMRKISDLPDILIYTAYILYVAIWSCYMAVIPPMFRVYAVIGREIPPYKTMMQDAALMLRLITAAQMCFYTMLLCAKLSLLILYRRLLTGLPTGYRRLWWSITILCVLVIADLTYSWLGSVFSSIFTCDNLKDKFQRGKCGGTPNEDQRIIFSLYFAYAVDVTTDLAIMFLPIRLTWNLQMPKAKKVGIVILFGSGFICIAFATLRVVQLGFDGRGRTTTPEPKWMLLWTILECSMAIIIGCSPAFAVFIRRSIAKSKTTSHNAHGYTKQPTSEDLPLRHIATSPLRPKPANVELCWDNTHSSEEDLAKSASSIVISSNGHRHSDIFLDCDRSDGS